MALADLSPGVPALRTYAPIRSPRFTTTTRGWRDRAELADFLGLSERGLNSFGRGPKLLRKPEGLAPAGAYTDRAVAIWMRDVSMTELCWLAYCQHRWPSFPLEPEAEAALSCLIEAERLWSK